MSNWDNDNVPKYGWSCDFVEDLRDSSDFESYEDCWMCGRERIRFVHHLTHPRYGDSIGVGCVCAGNLTGDTVAAQTREKKMISRAERRNRWLSRKWKVSAKGNAFLRIEKTLVTVYKTGMGYKFCTGDVHSKKTFASENTAKLGAFDQFWAQREAKIASPFNLSNYDNYLEAQWGAYFSNLNWKFTYKPNGIATGVNFLLHGRYDVPILVAHEPGMLVYKVTQLSKNWTTVLMLGHPFISKNFQHPMIGWLCEEGDERPQEAPFVQTDQGEFDFCHCYQSYEGRLTGYYEGGSWPLQADPLALWNSSRQQLFDMKQSKT